MKIITVLGNFSGRNAGDNAILGTLLDDVSALHSDIHFLVPTINKNFVKHHFGHHNLKALGLMPWNGAIKIFGLPTLRAMLQSDLVLVTDNILFEYQFYNPLFNYLSTISSIAPMCQKRGIPIVPYNASLGPINTPTGVRAMQRLLNASPLIILRDEQSKCMLDEKQIRYQAIHQGADCAINAVPPNKERMDEIIQKEKLFQNPKGTLSFNINAYIDAWRKDGKSFGRERFLKIIGTTLNKLIKELDVDVMYTITQVMDTKITLESLKYVHLRDRIKVVSNTTYTYQEITGLLQQAELHVGMRTHSIILAAAALTPVVGINAYPKTLGFMRTIAQDNWLINFDELTTDNFTALIKRAWEQRRATAEAMRPHVQREQSKAKSSVSLIGELLRQKKQSEQAFVV